VAKVIAALRDTLAWGASHHDEVVGILEKSANLPTKDAKVYVGLWDAMNRVSFEPADIETLKLQHKVFIEGGLVKGELKDELFATKPYAEAKNLK
jgi:NitT/TauT family transport system substrate-binding protein